jgi:hypothetical protein
MSDSTRSSRTTNEDRPMIRRSHPTTILVLLVVGAFTRAARADDQDLCRKVGQETKETVIAFEPPSTFAICRAGQVGSDVVTGRPIYVEVLADPNTLFRYSIHGLGGEPERTGLTRLARRSHDLAKRLHDLALAEESVDESSDALAPTEEKQLRYLRRWTAKMHDAIAAIERESYDLPVAATTLKTWCAEATHKPIVPAALDQAVRDRCAALPTSQASQKTAKLVETIGAFRSAREEVRALWLAPHARAPGKGSAPGDDSAMTGAMARLRDSALLLQKQASELAPLAEGVAETGGLLHEALRASGGALRANTPFYLGEMGRGGFAVVQIDATPLVLFRSAEDWDGTNQEVISRKFRFSVVARHYVDVEAGIAMAGGTPGVPGANSRGGRTYLASKSVSQFVGLLLLELEPVRFFAPDNPLAGVLRFPVLGVPLSRDPTQNYFAGAGLGWTGVGSITAGPYITRQASFVSGYADGQLLPAGVSLASTTSPAYQVGYFVSASIDLLGILHLFLPPHEPTYDALSGRDVTDTSH